jgi:hypothetical protein
VAMGPEKASNLIAGNPVTSASFFSATSWCKKSGVMEGTCFLVLGPCLLVLVLVVQVLLLLRLRWR